MALSAADLAVVQSLSRENVQSTLAGIKSFSDRSSWIGKRNRYARDTVEKIKNELGASGIVRPRQLSQYIAASVILHCCDGWSYLGRASHALLRGDPHRARHLAYYAELRAAMSLLASVGIGVFNNKHFAIDSPNHVSLIGSGHRTHVFVWECIEAWGGLSHSGDLFARLVQPNGIDLGTWLQPIGGAPAVAAQAKAWFLQWGMDLEDSGQDQYIRNESSYRPDGLHKSWEIVASEVLDFISDFWKSMEPSISSRFENVDRQILRLAVESAFKGTRGNTRTQAPAAYRSFAQRVVAAQNLSDGASIEWANFLCRTVMPKNIGIMQYSQLHPTVSAKSHLSVFSRAALLLRVASGSTLELLKDIGTSADDMAFWWGALGNARGIWDGQRDSNTIMDLWADVEPHLEAVSEFQRTVASKDQTFFRVAREIIPEVYGLGGTERIAVWSLTP